MLIIDRIKKVYYFFACSSQLAWWMWRQNSYYKTLLKNEFQEFNDFFSQKTNSKKINYYALLIPVMLGDVWTILRGKKLTADERKILTLIGMFTPLMDDWFDSETVDYKYINNGIFNPSLLHNLTEKEKLRQKLLIKMHEIAPNETNWETTALQIIDAQQLSKRQTKVDIKLEELKKIIFNKGAYSALIVRKLLTPNPDEAETNAMAQLGAMIQYLDDIFDVYEDYHDNIKTFPNITNNINELKHDYHLEMQKMTDLFDKTNYQYKNRQRYIYYIKYLFIRGDVCINQFLDLQKLNNGIFDIKMYERKELICDMERFNNILKTFFYYLR